MAEGRDKLPTGAAPKDGYPVYVAGSTKDTDRVMAMQSDLIYAGCRITFDWTGPEGAIRGDWSKETDTAHRISNRERDAVKEAEAVVVLPPDRGLGCWIEVGMALAHHTPVYVLESDRESVFWYIGEVRKHPWKDIVRCLREEANAWKATRPTRKQMGWVVDGHGVRWRVYDDGQFPLGKSIANVIWNRIDRRQQLVCTPDGWTSGQPDLRLMSFNPHTVRSVESDQRS